MNPGAAAVAEGTVWHARHRPAAHAFEQRVSYVWIDPDRPEEVTDHHPLWSASHAAPVRFRRSDYGSPDLDEELAEGVRRELGAALGRELVGPVRMLTQMRRLGWLFNPLTLYVAWDEPTEGPVGAVLEVTNTPWKERHRYAHALIADGGHWTATFPKLLHVSPFLTMDHRYRLVLGATDARLSVVIDVLAADGAPVVQTAMDLRLTPPSSPVLGRGLRRALFATFGVSAGIHRQAASLFRKGVPFIRHPRRESSSQETRST